MDSIYFIINVIGIVVFLGIAFLFSKRKRKVNWRGVITLLVINLLLAFLFTKFSWGRAFVQSLTNGFSWLIQISYSGIEFALPSWVHQKPMDFVTSALLPILMVVPLFDILTYIGVLPFIIKWLGKGLSKLTGQPKFESFFSVEMMFLGNTEALAVSSLQLKHLSPARLVTIAMMSMSCVSASIIGVYGELVPGQFVLTAIPLNIFNAIMITSILNPTQASPEDDRIVELGDTQNDYESNTKDKHKYNPFKNRPPFFSFLGDSILNAGKLILIITVNVIAFVALATLISKLLELINPWLSLDHILGIIMFPFAWLMGMDVNHAFSFAQYMGTKIVTNEFIVMGEISPHINNPKLFPPHYQAEITVFLTSFANFSTVGMIIGAFKGLVDKKDNMAISKNVGYMLLSGLLVSLMSAAIIGLMVW